MRDIIRRSIILDPDISTVLRCGLYRLAQCHVTPLQTVLSDHFTIHLESNLIRPLRKIVGKKRQVNRNLLADRLVSPGAEDLPVNEREETLRWKDHYPPWPSFGAFALICSGKKWLWKVCESRFNEKRQCVRQRSLMSDNRQRSSSGFDVARGQVLSVVAIDRQRSSFWQEMDKALPSASEERARAEGEVKDVSKRSRNVAGSL